MNAQTLKPVAPVMECADLKSLDLQSAVGSPVAIRAVTKVEDGKPAPYCRVEGSIDPAVRFEVRLPLAGWTQRFLQTGCGGLCGNLNINVGRSEGCAPATNGELVLASTDMGHTGPGRGSGIDDGAWAVGKPQSKTDFAYRGVHVTTLAAKALIAKYYGQKQRWSYFSGCSDGGREALMEAERYPEDFDGIAAGAPAMNFVTQNSFYHGWNAHVNTKADGKAILTGAQLPALHKAALEACKAVDGLILNPAACHFDPATAVCRAGEDPATCLTEAQANTAREIYRGAHDEAGHRFVISGPMPGSELFWQGVYVPQNSGQPIFSEGIARGTIKYLLYPEPLPEAWQLKDFRFEQATFNAIRPMHAVYDATNPEISRFAAKGGKLFVYHGWSDPHISPLNSIAFYDAVRRTLGDAKTDASVRLYLFPGGNHCSGGDGPFDFPLLSLMMNWVENGAAPGTITATHAQGRGGPVEMTRQVPPYSKANTPVDSSRFVWEGSGFYKP